MLGLLGPNGAGKTTLLSILVMAQEPTEGTRDLLRNRRRGPSSRGHPFDDRLLTAGVHAPFQPQRHRVLALLRPPPRCLPPPPRPRRADSRPSGRRGVRSMRDSGEPISTPAACSDGSAWRKLSSMVRNFSSSTSRRLDSIPKRRIRFRNLITELAEEIPVLLSTPHRRGHRGHLSALGDHRSGAAALRWGAASVIAACRGAPLLSAHGRSRAERWKAYQSARHRRRAISDRSIVPRLRVTSKRSPPPWRKPAPSSWPSKPRPPCKTRTCLEDLVCHPAARVALAVAIHAISDRPSGLYTPLQPCHPPHVLGPPSSCGGAHRGSDLSGLASPRTALGDCCVCCFGWQGISPVTGLWQSNGFLWPQPPSVIPATCCAAGWRNKSSSFLGLSFLP